MPQKDFSTPQEAVTYNLKKYKCCTYSNAMELNHQLSMKYLLTTSAIFGISLGFTPRNYFSNLKRTSVIFMFLIDHSSSILFADDCSQDAYVPDRKKIEKGKLIQLDDRNRYMKVHKTPFSKKFVEFFTNIIDTLSKLEALDQMYT